MPTVSHALPIAVYGGGRLRIAGKTRKLCSIACGVMTTTCTPRGAIGYPLAYCIVMAVWKAGRAAMRAT